MFPMEMVIRNPYDFVHVYLYDKKSIELFVYESIYIHTVLRHTHMDAGKFWPHNPNIAYKQSKLYLDISKQT